MSIESVKETITFQKKIVGFDIWHCCLNCNFWARNEQARNQSKTDPGPVCLRYNVEPPPEVLVVSCENWISNVPF